MPDKAQQDADFAAWEREFALPEASAAPDPKESRFRKVAHLFFKLLDAEGRRIEREGIGPDDYDRFRRPPTPDDEHGKAA